MNIFEYMTFYASAFRKWAKEYAHNHSINYNDYNALLNYLIFHYQTYHILSKLKK